MTTPIPVLTTERVDLRRLGPNPMRDFKFDPINEEQVARLTDSIKEHDYWGGVVCRRTKSGQLQIANGHHLVRAAAATGLTSINVNVTELDDLGMILVQARANGLSLHRDDVHIWGCGAVLSLVRLMARRQQPITRVGVVKLFGIPKLDRPSVNQIVKMLQDCAVVTVEDGKLIPISEDEVEQSR